MKKYLMLILLASGFIFAQKTTTDKRYKEVEGRYGGNDGICLFDDGKYMLYGYATAIFGTYIF